MFSIFKKPSPQYKDWTNQQWIPTLDYFYNFYANTEGWRYKISVNQNAEREVVDYLYHKDWCANAWLAFRLLKASVPDDAYSRDILKKEYKKLQERHRYELRNRGRSWGQAMKDIKREGIRNEN